MTIGTEGLLEDAESVLILSSAGASGLSSQVAISWPSKGSSIKAQALKPDGNTNIACQRTLIPVIERDSIHGLETGDELVFITRVFAISASANCNRKIDRLADRWRDQPRVSIGEESHEGDCIFWTPELGLE
jgi:hypothetical protein